MLKMLLYLRRAGVFEVCLYHASPVHGSSTHSTTTLRLLKGQTMPRKAELRAFEFKNKLWLILFD